METTSLGPQDEEERFQLEMDDVDDDDDDGPSNPQLRVVQRVLPSNSLGRRRFHPRRNAKLSTTERPVQGVPMPIAHTLRSDVLFTTKPGGKVEINISALKTHFYHEGRLEVNDVLYILNTATEIFRSEPNVLHITSPINSNNNNNNNIYY